MPKLPQPSAAKDLVVLAHGFLGARVQLLPVAASLSQRYDVLNFAYRSRQDTLAGHARSLVDGVGSRLARKKQRVHFVTHSFGGLVAHRAFSEGLAELLDLGKTRCVMIGPPFRGAAFARAFRRENIGGPEVLRGVVHAAARSIMGDFCGMELMMRDEEWFKENLGQIPDEVRVLVVAGAYGRINPLIGGLSDGVVGVEETRLDREHFRMEVACTHNLLLYSPKVWRSISEFLEGRDVGELVGVT